MTPLARLVALPALILLSACVNVSKVEIRPVDRAQLPAKSLQLVADVFDSSGQKLGGAEILWTSSNPAVVTVAARSGLVTIAGPGTAEVTANCEGVSSKPAKVTVTNEPSNSIPTAVNSQITDAVT